MRLKPEELKQERVKIELFVKARMEHQQGGCVPAAFLYDRYKKQYPDTNLSHEGFGKLMPERVRATSKLKWHNGKPRRCYMGWGFLVG